ncbi:MAG: hypothetical protein HW380_2979 [Magnetococcales bacterium]|nr:hypothetical protein [Magnetococcales bacterium]
MLGRKPLRDNLVRLIGPVIDAMVKVPLSFFPLDGRSVMPKKRSP